MTPLTYNCRSSYLVQMDYKTMSTGRIGRDVWVCGRKIKNLFLAINTSFDDR
jgi:hypothetical protein